MCTGSAPWPYITAGILLSRRILRAAPLPNWVRIWATSLVSDTSFSWCCSGCLGVAHAGRGTAHTSLICLVGFWCGGPRRGARHGPMRTEHHRVDHGLRTASRTTSLAEATPEV